MKENKNNKTNSFSIKEKDKTGQEYIDDDEGCFNLIQNNEKFFTEEKEEENNKFLSKKRKGKETDIIYNANSKLFENAFNSLTKKFGENGYAQHYYKDVSYDNFLRDIRKLLQDKDKFKKTQREYIENLKAKHKI